MLWAKDRVDLRSISRQTSFFADGFPINLAVLEARLEKVVVGDF